MTRNPNLTEFGCMICNIELPKSGLSRAFHFWKLHHQDYDIILDDIMDNPSNPCLIFYDKIYLRNLFETEMIKMDKKLKLKKEF